MEQFIGFWDLTKKQQERLAADGMLNIRTFGKRQVLMNQDDDADNVGVMLSGTAFLESMNQEGQRRILDYYEPKESFARKCFPDVEGVCYVISRSSCQVAFFVQKSRKTGVNDSFSGLNIKSDMHWQCSSTVECKDYYITEVLIK